MHLVGFEAGRELRRVAQSQRESTSTTAARRSLEVQATKGRSKANSQVDLLPLLVLAPLVKLLVVRAARGPRAPPLLPPVSEPAALRLSSLHLAVERRRSVGRPVAPCKANEASKRPGFSIISDWRGMSRRLRRKGERGRSTAPGTGKGKGARTGGVRLLDHEPVGAKADLSSDLVSLSGLPILHDWVECVDGAGERDGLVVVEDEQRQASPSTRYSFMHFLFFCSFLKLTCYRPSPRGGSAVVTERSPNDVNAKQVEENGAWGMDRRTGVIKTKGKYKYNLPLSPSGQEGYPVGGKPVTGLSIMTGERKDLRSRIDPLRINRPIPHDKHASVSFPRQQT